MEQDLHNAQHHKTMDLNKDQFVVQATIWKKEPSGCNGMNISVLLSNPQSCKLLCLHTIKLAYLIWSFDK